MIPGVDNECVNCKLSDISRKKANYYAILREMRPHKGGKT